jgi:membrane protease subunit (stomatin/prohibitin family)
MPGLLRGMARTAVVAGTATAVSNRVSRRQARRWSGEDPYAQQQAYAAPPQQQYAAPAPAAAPAEEDPMDQLRELAQLKNEGVLTDEEFAAAKAKILGT